MRVHRPSITKPISISRFSHQELYNTAASLNVFTCGRRLTRGAAYSVTTILSSKSMKSKLFVLLHTLCMILFIASVNSLVRRLSQVLSTCLKTLYSRSVCLPEPRALRRRCVAQYDAMGRLIRSCARRFLSTSSSLKSRTSLLMAEQSRVIAALVSGQIRGIHLNYEGSLALATDKMDDLRKTLNEEASTEIIIGGRKWTRVSSEAYRGISNYDDEIMWSNTALPHNGMKSEVLVSSSCFLSRRVPDILFDREMATEAMERYIDIYSSFIARQYTVPALEEYPVSVPLVLRSSTRFEAGPGPWYGPLSVMQVTLSSLSTRPQSEVTAIPSYSSPYLYISHSSSGSLLPPNYLDYQWATLPSFDGLDGRGKSGSRSLIFDVQCISETQSLFLPDEELEQRLSQRPLGSSIIPTLRPFIIPIECETSNTVTVRSTAKVSALSSSPMMSAHFTQSPSSSVEELELQLSLLRTEAVEGEKEVQRLVALIREGDLGVTDSIGIIGGIDHTDLDTAIGSQFSAQTLLSGEAEAALRALSAARVMGKAKLTDLSKKVCIQEEKLKLYSAQIERLARERARTANRGDPGPDLYSSSIMKSNSVSSGSEPVGKKGAEARKYGRRERDLTGRQTRSWPPPPPSISLGDARSSGNGYGSGRVVESELSSGAMAAAMASRAQQWVQTAVASALDPHTVDVDASTRGKKREIEEDRERFKNENPAMQKEREKSIMRAEATEAMEEIEATLNAISKEAFACFAKYVSERLEERV